MSAEGKKKRGESGRVNALNNPFRLNGLPADWQARRAGAYHVPASASSGSVTMRGIVGGLLAQNMGFTFHGKFDRLVAHAQTRVTHPMLSDDEPVKQAAE